MGNAASTWGSLPGALVAGEVGSWAAVCDRLVQAMVQQEGQQEGQLGAGGVEVSMEVSDAAET